MGLWCRDFTEAETKGATTVKVVQEHLDDKVLARFTMLTENEIKTLVVEDKCFASIQAAVEIGVQGLTRQLTGCVTVPEERYSFPSFVGNLKASTLEEQRWQSK